MEKKINIKGIKFIIESIGSVVRVKNMNTFEIIEYHMPSQCYSPSKAAGVAIGTMVYENGNY